MRNSGARLCRQYLYHKSRERLKSYYKFATNSLKQTRKMGPRLQPQIQPRKISSNDFQQQGTKHSKKAKTELKKDGICNGNKILRSNYR